VIIRYTFFPAEENNGKIKKSAFSTSPPIVLFDDHGRDGWKRMSRDVKISRSRIAVSVCSGLTSNGGSRRSRNKGSTTAWRRTQGWRGSSVFSFAAESVDDNRVRFHRLWDVRAQNYEGKISVMARCTTY
jgi:hypothetical protein